MQQFKKSLKRQCVARGCQCCFYDCARALPIRRSFRKGHIYDGVHNERADDKSDWPGYVLCVLAPSSFLHVLEHVVLYGLYIFTRQGVGDARGGDINLWF